ncbi:MAG: damage-inducible protein DinB [Deltaproteobacteria bacterium]|nr:damage-inducible protein DinB [Deltaproteobacteria bacterium]MBI3390714.1 damage-inducible protein DinB [Deltaproteobacteria bacterium]
MATLLGQYQALAGYNRWMNDKLYALCATLTDEERKRSMGAFFGSIHGTLNHLLLTDRAWLGRFTRDATVATSLDHSGQPIPYTGKLDQVLYDDFALLRQERAKTDAAIEAWLRGLSDADFDAPLSYRTSAGVPYKHPLWWAVTHFFNHQTHHRGQLTTLLSQLGHDPGGTDFPVFLRTDGA